MIFQKEVLSAGIDLPIVLIPPLMLEVIHCCPTSIVAFECIFSILESKDFLIDAPVVAEKC